jgi:uncharacterized protein (DUF302 family)
MKMRKLASALVAMSFATASVAEEAVMYTFDGSFEDASFALESAILDRGLVIDHISHIGDMLNRTGADVGSDVKLFENAQVFMFCSAVVSRQVMEADPMNIIHCPYNVFVFEREGAVTMGHRDYPASSMDPVEALLSEIVTEARGG